MMFAGSIITHFVAFTLFYSLEIVVFAYPFQHVAWHGLDVGVIKYLSVV